MHEIRSLASRPDLAPLFSDTQNQSTDAWKRTIREPWTTLTAARYILTRTHFESNQTTRPPFDQNYFSEILRRERKVHFRSFTPRWISCTQWAYDCVVSSSTYRMYSSTMRFQRCLYSQPRQRLWTFLIFLMSSESSSATLFARRRRC